MMNKYLFFLIFFVFFASCKNSNENTKAAINQNIESEDNNKLANNDTNIIEKDSNINKLSAKNKSVQQCCIFEDFEIPAPSEFVYSVEKTQPVFDQLYPLDAKSDFHTTYKKSVALGIYTADLVYCSAYQNSNLINKYYALSLKLANELGLSGSFNPDDFELIQNTNNYDTVNVLIDKAIQIACTQLDDSKAYDELPFILYGGWLESVFLLTKTLIENKEAPDLLYKQLAKQPKVIENIIKFNNDIIVDADNYDVNLNIQSIISELKEINKILKESYTTSKYILSRNELLKFNKIISETRKNINEPADLKFQQQIEKDPTKN